MSSCENEEGIERPMLLYVTIVEMKKFKILQYQIEKKQLNFFELGLAQFELICTWNK